MLQRLLQSPVPPNKLRHTLMYNQCHSPRILYPCNAAQVYRLGNTIYRLFVIKDGRDNFHGFGMDFTRVTSVISGALHFAEVGLEDWG